MVVGKLAIYALAAPWLISSLGHAPVVLARLLRR
jgi:hypothetical protein